MSLHWASAGYSAFGELVAVGAKQRRVGARRERPPRVADGARVPIAGLESVRDREPGFSGRARLGPCGARGLDERVGCVVVPGAVGLEDAAVRERREE